MRRLGGRMLNTKIVAIIHPFDIKQTIYVYQNGNKLKIIQSQLDKISQDILSLSKQYNAKNIYLSGSKNYSFKIEQQIKEKNLNYINNNKININYI